MQTASLPHVAEHRLPHSAWLFALRGALPLAVTNTPLAVQVRALKALSLNVRRAKVKHADGNVKNKFYVTDSHTADKIVKSARLEEIRLSILQNLQFYHPEAGERLAWGRRAKKASSRSSLEPLGVKPQ